MGRSYEFKIKLDSPGKQFRPGDAVTGKVDLQVIKSITVRDINVTLRGVAESANYTYVTNYNAVTRRHERRKMTNSITYHFFAYGVKVFPPPNLQQHGLAGEYTLAEGQYSYPFELSFPSGPVEAKSSSHFDVSRTYMSTPLMFMPPWANRGSGSASSMTISLPPAFRMYRDYDDHAIVDYVLEAHADRKGFLKSDFSDKQLLRFSPNLDSVMFSFAPITQNGVFIPNYFQGASRLKFEIGKSKRHEGKSFFKRVFSSRSLKVPFEIVGEFKQRNAVLYPQGQTSRVLHQGDNLADVLDLRIYTPFSKDALQRILIGEEGKKSGPVAPLSNLLIKEISVTLGRDIYYQGIEEQRTKNEVSVGKQAFKNEFELSDFEEVDYRGSDIFLKIKQDYAEHYQSGKAYMLEIPPQMYAFLLSCDAQSFSAPNILCDVLLKLNFLLTTTEENPSMARIICETPIVFLPGRVNTGGSDLFVPPGGPPPAVNGELSTPLGPPPLGSEIPEAEELPSYSDVKHAS